MEFAKDGVRVFHEFEGLSRPQGKP
jgi:hypothetical protein